MYVCDAAGKYAKERCRIAKVLIDRLADVEVVDQLGNTPFLLAAVGGYIPMLELLYVVGANIHAVNDAGANARSRCKLSSGSTCAFLDEIHVGCADRQYPREVHRGARSGPSQVSRHRRLNAYEYNGVRR